MAKALTEHQIWFVVELTRRGWVDLGASVRAAWESEAAAQLPSASDLADLAADLRLGNRQATDERNARDVRFAKIMAAVARALPNARNIRRESADSSAVRFAYDGTNWRACLAGSNVLLERAEDGMLISDRRASDVEDIVQATWEEMREHEDRD